MQNTLKNTIILITIILIIFVSISIYSDYKINYRFNAYEGSLDNGRIYYKVYIPKNIEAHLAVLIHGFGGSSEMMDIMASALAENGVMAIAYDIPGHGKSVGSLYKNFSNMYKDFLLVIEKAKEFGAVTDSITIIGHSMGAGFAQIIAKNDTRVKCLIILGSSPNTQILNKDIKVNLLVLNGKNDEIVDIKRCLKAFENITGLKNVTFGKIYGSFKENDAREFYVSELNDHLTILYSEESVNKVVSWVTEYYNLENVRMSTSQRLIVYILTSIITFVLAILAIKLIPSKLSKDENLFKNLSRKPIIAYFILTFLTAPIALLLQTPLSIILPLFISDFIIAFFYTQIVAIFLTFYIYKKISKISIKEIIKKYFKMDNLIRRCIISLFIFLLTYLTYILMFKNFLNIQLPFHRYLYFLSSIPMILPYTFFNELFFRVLVGSLTSKKWYNFFTPIILRITGLLTFYSSIMIIATSLSYSGGMIGYLLIVVYMFAILQIGLDIISSTIFTKTGSITEQAISTAIMYSAILTSISPMI
ncbi:MAG: alpha/beta fold hydrolase [Nitrososphaeria archaeon]|nr:alpha/beta fold hydrolase [Nitrososphaeria archaeon]